MTKLPNALRSGVFFFAFALFMSAKAFALAQQPLLCYNSFMPYISGGVIMTDKKKELIRTLKFVLFSISAGVIQVISFTLMEEVWHLTHWLSYLVALILSVVWNFTLNRKFTFYSANNVPIAMLKVAAFYLAFTPLSTWWTAVLTGDGFLWNEYLVLILTMLINFVTEYLYDRFIVFGKSIDTAKKTENNEKATEVQI